MKKSKLRYALETVAELVALLLLLCIGAIIVWCIVSTIVIFVVRLFNCTGYVYFPLNFWEVVMTIF